MAGGEFREVVREVVPDERGIIASKLREWCDAGIVDLVITTGGTGLGPRDVTPEATRDVIHLEAPGFGEAMRVQTLEQTPYAILSRGVAGVRSGCLIVNLPGSPSGVEQCLGVVGPAIPHALEMVRGFRTHEAP
jgi:molybdopterin adenylyltransferase